MPQENRALRRAARTKPLHERRHAGWKLRTAIGLPLLVACAVALGSAPKADSSPVRMPPLLIGVGDQSQATFTKPLYRSLGLQISRLVVPWNAALHADRKVWIRQWLAAARADGIEPMIAFGRFSGQTLTPPSVGAYRRAFMAFRTAFPQVREYTPWNEANHQSQPTFRRPARAAAYYKVMRAGCPGCTVLGADVLDTHSAEKWLRQFIRALHGPVPQVWGLHNYIDVNRHHPVARGGTAKMLGVVPGQIWLTETGGLVKTAALPYNEKRAATATRYLFTIANAWRPRIARVYLYNWRGVLTARQARRQPKAWDSGMTEPNGKPRPAYFALRSEMKRRHLGCWDRRPSVRKARWRAGCK